MLAIVSAALPTGNRYFYWQNATKYGFVVYA